MPAFLAALVEEARAVTEALGNPAWRTIYFGGGTPSMLSTTLLEEFLPRFRHALGNPAVEEWTFEMNPRTLDATKLALLREHGVTRASLGVQAWDAPTLTTLGRDHTPEEAEESFQLLRQARFPVVSLDLMFAIPGQTLAAWRDSLAQTVALQPDHISCYNLTYEEDTAFFERFEQGEYQRDEATDEAFFLDALDYLENAGFRHYETSNYARPGFESRHNRGYWCGEDYVGLGPSAVSTVRRVRTKNVADTAGYIRAIAENERAVAETEHLSETQWRCERIALELRTAEGLALEMLGEGAPGLAELCHAELTACEQGRVILTRRGKLVADSVIEHLWNAQP